MDLKATIASSYRNRLLLIALAALLYASWCVYDAVSAYPDKQKARAAYETVQERYPDSVSAEWERTANENGWDPSVVPEVIDTWNIRTQWIQFGLVFPIGAYCLFSIALWSRRYVGADEAKLYSHCVPDGVAFESITRVDAGRWDNKGIAVIYYDAGSGEQSLVIDDWKYAREPSDAVFDRIRENVEAEKVVGLAEPSSSAAEAEEAY